MSKTSSEVKRRWNKEHYDNVTITVKKGYKDVIKKQAEMNNESVTAYITRLIQADINK